MGLTPTTSQIFSTLTIWLCCLCGACQFSDYQFSDYSRTSHKRPPKMSSLCGRLREVVAYESLDHIGSIFCHSSVCYLQTLIPCFKHFIHVKINFEEKPCLPMEKFRSLVLPRNAIMLQQLLIQYMLYYLSSGHLWEVKNKKKFQNFSSCKSGRGHLWEVVAYKRCQI